MMDTNTRHNQRTKTKSADSVVRKSVFDRLGPRSENNVPNQPVTNTTQAATTNRRPGYPTRSRSSSTNRHQQPPHSNNPTSPPSSTTTTPCTRTLQPNAILARTLKTIQKERNAEAIAASPSARVQDLQSKIAALDAEKTSAQLLINELLASQQALMKEKKDLARENEALKQEGTQLKEQLEYLLLQQGQLCASEPSNNDEEEGDMSSHMIQPGCLLLEEQGYHTACADDQGNEQEEEPPLTPDSGILKALMIEGRLSEQELGELACQLQL